MVVEAEDPTSAEARALIAALEADIEARYPGAPIRHPDAVSLVASGGLFLVARREGRAVACGALRPLEPGAIEVKRMFVSPEARRQGIARQMLSSLEAAAKQRGVAIVRIETGFNQPEAVALYDAAGYRRVPCFGEYAGNSYSICFEKSL